MATGDAQRFLSVFEQYKANPDVTSRRLYLETVEGIMQGMNKILIDSGPGGAVPYLPLDQLMKQPKGTPAPQLAEPPSPAPSASSSDTSATSTGAN